MPDVFRFSLKTRRELEGTIHSSLALRTVRACLLTTRDRDYAFSLAREIAVGQSISLYHFTASGCYSYEPGKGAWTSHFAEDSLDAYSLLRKVQALRRSALVILEDVLSGLSDKTGDGRARVLLAHLLSANPSRFGLVLLFLESRGSEIHLPSILADQFVRLDIPSPRGEELENIAREEIAGCLCRGRPSPAVEQVRALASRLGPELAGLTRSAARDALRDALLFESGDLDRACEYLSGRKWDLLRRELAMNILDNAEVEQPIGLDFLVEYVKIHRKRMSEWGSTRARGILLIGPPGTGKTMLARAIGKLAGLPVIEFRLSSLMNSLLGETERHFMLAFDTFAAMSPNVVFIDEIEKAFGDSSERDGGTMMRCTGALLTWLSDNTCPNFVVATSNSLQRMGDVGLTLTRSERFDAVFFVDVPCLAARSRMLREWLQPHIPNAGFVADEIAATTEKFSGADLRSAVKLAVSRAEFEGAPLTAAMLEGEMDRKRPRAIALYSQFEGLRRWAATFCEPAGPSEGDSVPIQT